MAGVREECILRSNVGFMALHGGSQDRGTAEMAGRAAERAGASYYAIVQPPGLRVHLTSRLHNPDHSASLQAFLEHVDIAISVHGFGREGFALWLDADCGLIIEPYGPAVQGRQTEPLRGIILGGLNAQLLDSARRLFQGRFAGYHVADERIRLGFHPDNPVNLPSAHGVQIELPLVCAESAISARSGFQSRRGRHRSGGCARRPGGTGDGIGAHDGGTKYFDMSQRSSVTARSVGARRGPPTTVRNSQGVW